jgi:hypothetical protein
MTKQAELELCYNQGVQAAFEKVSKVGFTGLALASSGTLAGGFGASDAKDRMREAGISYDDMQGVLSTPGGAARGFGKQVGYGLGGLGVGALSGGVLGGLAGGARYGLPGLIAGAAGGGALGLVPGAVAGGLYGAYRGYQGEQEKATEAIKKHRSRTRL